MICSGKTVLYGRNICGGFRLLPFQRVHKLGLSSNSPGKWRPLFFGTDIYSLFALQPLLELYGNAETPLISHLGVCSKFSEPTCEVAKFLIRTKLDNVSFVDYKTDKPPADWDIGVVASFGSLIPKSFIQAFPYGIICIHPSLLPRWRGAAPLMRTIQSGDQISGTTLFHISSDKFDTGPIISQHTLNVPSGVTSRRLGQRLMQLGVEMLIEILKDLPNAVENAVAQSADGITYAKKVRPAETFVDWRWTADQVDRHFRAFYEDFGVKTIWENQIVKIGGLIEPDLAKEACVDNLVSENNSCGRLLFHKKRNILFVRCADDWVGLTEISIPDRKPMSAKDFYNGFLSPNKNRQDFFESDKTEIVRLIKRPSSCVHCAKETNVLEVPDLLLYLKTTINGQSGNVPEYQDFRKSKHLHPTGIRAFQAAQKRC